MRSSRTITLFSELPELSQRPSSFLVSVLAHIGAIALLSLGILYSPEFREPLIPRRFTIRHLDLRTPETKVRESASTGMAYPGPRAPVNKPAPGSKPAERQASLRQTADADIGPQTLVEPDITEPVKLALETPVPTVIIWSPRREVVKQVVAPKPEIPTAADVKPSIKPPNQEINLGDTGISSAEVPTDKLPIFPTTTSPLTVHGPKILQMAPVTASQKTAQPTPTAVMSISDLRMPDGTATLPPVNETTVQSESGILAPGQAAKGDPSKQIGGTGREAAAGDAGGTNGVMGERNGTKPGSGVGSGSDEGLTTQRFTLPKNGEFGAIVVGANLEEKYPELSSIWNDRVAYTVYLHVGLQKSWIMQYSLPRNSEADQAGNITRLEAPWPYNIVRPNIPPGAFNSDAILVHGFVNAAGRFETLGIVFPPEFQQAQFVLDALSQWQFRPAVQNGKIEKVEVMLIIPEEQD
jgi:hypothetical protein